MEIIILITVTVIWWQILSGSLLRRGLAPYAWLFMLYKGIGEINLDKEDTPRLGKLKIEGVNPLHLVKGNVEYLYTKPTWIERRWIRRIEWRVGDLTRAMGTNEGSGGSRWTVTLTWEGGCEYEGTIGDIE